MGSRHRGRLVLLVLIVTAHCACCHLEGIHGGAIQARGPASDLRRKLGRKPIVEVHGGERTLLRHSSRNGRIERGRR